MALRLANESTDRIELADGGWVEVRKDVSKRTMNALLAHMPKRDQKELKEKGLTIEEGLDFQVGLFVSLVTSWSVGVPPTAEAYLGLEVGPETEELDTKLAEHFEAIMPSKEEQGKA